MRPRNRRRNPGPDVRLRQLERRAKQSGTSEDHCRWTIERLRVGDAMPIFPSRRGEPLGEGDHVLVSNFHDPYFGHVFGRRNGVQRSDSGAVEFFLPGGRLAGGAPVESVRVSAGNPGTQSGFWITAVHDGQSKDPSEIDVRIRILFWSDRAGFLGRLSFTEFWTVGLCELTDPNQFWNSAQAREADVNNAHLTVGLAGAASPLAVDVFKAAHRYAAAQPMSFSHGVVPDELTFAWHVTRALDEDGDPIWDGVYSSRLHGVEADFWHDGWEQIPTRFTHGQDPSAITSLEALRQLILAMGDEWGNEDAEDNAANLASTVMHTLGYEWI